MTVIPTWGLLALKHITHFSWYQCENSYICQHLFFYRPTNLQPWKQSLFLSPPLPCAWWQDKSFTQWYKSLFSLIYHTCSGLVVIRMIDIDCQYQLMSYSDTVFLGIGMLPSISIIPTNFTTKLRNKNCNIYNLSLECIFLVGLLLSHILNHEEMYFLSQHIRLLVLFTQIVKSVIRQW